MSTAVGPNVVALIKDAVQAIGASFTRADDDWIPVMVTIGKSGVGVTPIPITADREATTKAITYFLASVGATEAAMVASSWMIKRADAVTDDDLPIREHPDRKEVLILSHVTPDSLELEIAEIFRDGTNPPKLTEWSDAEGGALVTGMFADAMRLGIEQARAQK